MQVNNFESSNKARLNQILHTLHHVHGVKINFDLSSADVDKSLMECQKNYEKKRDLLIQESAFNSYLQNPEYTKSILILEAVKLMLTEIAPKRRRRTTVAESITNKDNKQAVPAAKNFAEQLRDLASKVPLGSDAASAFSNALAALAEKLKYKEELEDIEKEIILWMRSLPKPVQVSKLIYDGVAKFGQTLLDMRDDEIRKFKKIDRNIAKNANAERKFGKSGEDMKKTTMATEGKKIDQDGDGDKDFADVMIARMVASGVPKHVAIAKVKNKKYNAESEDTLAEQMDSDAIVSMNAPNTDANRHAHHYEYQASMARSELYRNAKYAMSMMKQIDPHGEVQPWIAGALTKAANYLDKIYHYLDYYKKFEPEQLPEDMDQDLELGETSGGVTRQNLMMIMEYSTKLFDMIKPGDKLEGWVAMKLTTASECISSCKHYLDYVQFENHGLDDHFAEARRAKSLKESAMLSEQEDLAKASTILAAKDMSSSVQGIAEDVAKMSVEDLMPLVDIMRGQFGSDAATAFNEVVKESLDALLDQATKTKETMDKAIDTLNQGGVPSAETDIEAASEPSDETAPEDEETAPEGDATAEIGNLGGEEPPTPEPLGRAKKEELAEKWNAKMHTAKKDIGKWDGYTLAELKVKKDKLMKKEKRTAAEQKEVQQLNFAIRAKQKNKWGKVDEAKSGKFTCKKCHAKYTSKDSKHDLCPECQDKKLDESAPPGKKAEKWILDNKHKFIKKHGEKAGMSRLYATAWKLFGKKNESYNAAMESLNSHKANLITLNNEFELHKQDFAIQLSENKISDPLHLGYGLVGTNLLQQIQETNNNIKALIKTTNGMVIDGALDIMHSVHNIEQARTYQQIKETTPYGVLYTSQKGKASKKLFETQAERDYWLEYQRGAIKDVRLIDPETFDSLINKTLKG